MHVAKPAFARLAAIYRRSIGEPNEKKKKGKKEKEIKTLRGKKAIRALGLLARFSNTFPELYRYPTYIYAANIVTHWARSATRCFNGNLSNARGSLPFCLIARIAETSSDIVIDE